MFYFFKKNTRTTRKVYVMAKLVPCKYCGCANTAQSSLYSEDYGYIGYCGCQNCGTTISTNSNNLYAQDFCGSTRYEGIKNVKVLWNKVMTSEDFNDYVTRGINQNFLSYEVIYKDDNHQHIFKVCTMKDLYRQIKLYNKYLGKDEDVLPVILYKENHEL